MKILIEKISLYQLCLLIILFEIGSAVIVGIGNEAKQDAWIAILLATGIGLLLVKMFTYTVSLVPKKNLFEIMEHAFGRVIAVILCFLYIQYFLYIAARVLRDFGEIMATVIFITTPLEFIVLVFMFVVAYVVYLGVEVLARLTELLFPYVFLFLFLISLFLFFQGSIHLENLKPTLTDGFSPVVQAIFPELIGFPFGELIVFTFLWPYTNRFEYVSRVSLIATAISGAILTFFSIINISTLGPDMIARSPFPFLSVARNVSLANFIERLDALVIFVMMIGVFVKVCIFFYGALKGLEYLSKQPYRSFVFPVAMLIPFFSVILSSNIAEHIEEGIKFVPHYFHMPFQVGIPLFLLITLILKEKLKGGRPSNAV